jgi:hypothetical protein
MIQRYVEEHQLVLHADTTLSFSLRKIKKAAHAAPRRYEYRRRLASCRSSLALGVEVGHEGGLDLSSP